MISRASQLKVFTAMVRIIETKSARNKMVSVFDIADKFKELDIDAPKIVIEDCLDVLIQQKYVRYYRDNRGYMYYGITELGWTKWDEKVERVISRMIERNNAEQNVMSESVTITDVCEVQSVIVIPNKPKRGRPRKTA